MDSFRGRMAARFAWRNLCHAQSPNGRCANAKDFSSRAIRA
jgi:hypothetical protein